MRIGALVATLMLGVAAVLPIDASGAAAMRDANPKPQVHTVIIEGMRYQPEGLTVTAGDTVVWINRDMVPHTATSAAGHFDSGEIAAGNSWRWTVRGTGEFAYSCTYHPMMKGVLRVK